MRLLLILLTTISLFACTSEQESSPNSIEVGSKSVGSEELKEKQNHEGPIKVEIRKTSNGFQLYRDGKPYQVKGAGMEVLDLERFAAAGGNSIRNWTTQHPDYTTRELLDKAHSLGLTVALCLPLAKEVWNFDYNNEDAVKKQYEEAKQEVLKYRDHPALLTWIIGNELNFNFKNPKVFDAINDIAKMIKELDPYHPTTTTLAGLDKRAVVELQKRTPDIDFISFQVYGQLAILPKTLVDWGFDAPFMVTEWGTIGFWEMQSTEWGAPFEMNSTEKANNYYSGYNEFLEPVSKNLIGDYVFLWGQKQERTPTWFGMFTDSNKPTESVDVMQYIWTGSWPANRAPQVNGMMLNGKNNHNEIKLKANTRNQARVFAVDPEKTKLHYRWEIKPESDSKQVAGAFEEDIPSILKIEKQDNPSIEFTSPSQAGAYRIFVYVYDDSGKVGHANVPFWVDA